MIKFSFIMAAYNSEKYIVEAIESVLNQDYENWELVIVNDGSTDNTPIIIDEYSSKYLKIKSIHQKHSGTAAAARNTALNYVTGDYVQMLDADDLVEKNLLSTYANRLKEREFDILIPNCRCFKNDKIDEIYWEKLAPNNNYIQRIDGEKAFYLSLNWLIHGAFLIKTQLIKGIKYDPILVNGDELTTRKFLYNARDIGFVDTFYFYRLNMNSTTKSSMNKYRMYESVLTNINIYQYAINCKMSDKTINMCVELLIKSLCRHSVMFYKNTQMDDTEDKDRAYKILKQTYMYITDDMWKRVPIKYRLFYLLSGNNFRLFMMEMKFISLARSI